MQRLSKPKSIPIVFLVALAVVTVICALRTDTTEQTSTELGVGNPETVRLAYDRWVERYRQYGNEDTLQLALQWSKALSAEYSTAAGRFELGLEDGFVSVSVQGLPQDRAYDVWLLDNRPGPGKSVRAEEGDRMLRIGRLERQDGLAVLETTLERDAIEGLTIDYAVVAPAGGDLAETGLLYGSPSLFQRIYHGLQRQEAQARESVSLAGFPFLVPAAAVIGSGGMSSMAQLVAAGERIFFEEKFNGNGRTCGSCHPADNNFTIDPAYIATLPKKDPLFVAEFNPHLAGLENPKLLRELALVRANVDGFDKPAVMRSVPHLLGLNLYLAAAPKNAAGESADGSSLPDVAPVDRTGWGGDGAPGQGALRDFPTGAVIQHFPKSLDRDAGVDFRLPTSAELDAMEAFMLSVGRQETPDVNAMKFTNPIAEAGKAVFMDEKFGGGRCTSCHHNGGANVSPALLAASSLPSGDYNFNFDIGVTRLPVTLGKIVDPNDNPPDRGWGRDAHAQGGYGNNKFNTMPAIEAADTGPYFHDNSILTLENAIEFYFGLEFNLSPSTAWLHKIGAPPPGGPPFAVAIGSTGLATVGSFLRVMNALENIRSATEYLNGLHKVYRKRTHARRFKAALADIDDAIMVLECVGLHADAIMHLKAARKKAVFSGGCHPGLLKGAVQCLAKARSMMLEEN
jgi:cytochrome c peroxidase